MIPKNARERHDSLLRELNEERAAALLRISNTLQQSIDELHGCLHELASAPPDERGSRLARCRELRERARQYRWYLEVQREAIGMRRHESLDEFYPIPAVE